MSFDTDPGEQARISASDFEQMCDEMKRLKERNAELEAKAAAMNVGDGGPAFPFVMPDPSTYHTEQGMTLRDYFAAAALQGVVHALEKGIRPIDVPVMARDCYGIADAMLAARKEGA